MPLNIEIDGYGGGKLNIEISDAPIYPIVTINDEAGIGDTDVVWSADKSSRRLDDKVDKVVGYSLVADDEIDKLSTVEQDAQKNVVNSVAGRQGDVLLDKEDVGLSNVDNTSDTNKPVSTAVADALANKVDKETGRGLIDPAPTDSKRYARKDGAWVEVAGDNFSVHKVGLRSERSLYDDEPQGFCFFATDETIVNNPIKSEILQYSSTDEYLLEGFVGGSLSLIVTVNGIIQSPSAYTVTDASDGDYILGISIEADDTLVVREIGRAFTNGAAYFKLSGASADWSDPVPFSQGAKGDKGDKGDTGGIVDAPADGKQYARKDNAWEEVTGGSGFRTELVGTTLYMSDDGSDPVPIVRIFSYEFEVEQGTPPGGGNGLTYYGVNESQYWTLPFGTFIKNIENDNIGKASSVMWQVHEGLYGDDNTYYMTFSAKNADYLLTYNNVVQLVVADQNGDILNMAIPPEAITKLPSGDVAFIVSLSEGQFNSLPKSGMFFADIVLSDVYDHAPDSGCLLIMGTLNMGPSLYFGYSEGDMGSIVGELPEGITSISSFFNSEGNVTTSMYRLHISDELYHKELKFKFGEIEMIVESSDNNQIEGTFDIPVDGFYQPGDIVPFSYEVLRDLSLPSDPVPNPNDLEIFSYEIEVEQYVEDDTFQYGVNEAQFSTPYGTFIVNNENDKIGKLVAVAWVDTSLHGYGYQLHLMAENADYLLTYSNNIEVVIKDQNGEILSVAIPPENIHGTTAITGEASVGAFITEEQFNLLPKSGIVFVDIGLYT